MAFQAKARLMYVSIPPRKMRLVASLVKGLPVEKAVNILNFTPRIAAHHLAKTLKSAVANALSTEGTDHLRPEDLLVKNIVVDEAPTQKRIRFQSMGRVFRYRKRFSHLTVIVEEQQAKVSAQAKVDAPVDAQADNETTKKKATTKKAATKKTTTKKATPKDGPSKTKISSKSKGTKAKTGGAGRTH